MITVRPERSSDVDAVRSVVTAAFPTDAEARLVDALRSAGRLTISLVADDGGRVVGHGAFSPVSGGGLGLAPVAVLPEVQRKGVGGELINEGLRLARGSGAPFVVVLGEPGYYSRFGFAAASRWGVADEYGGGDAFQAIVWGDAPPAGVIKYVPEFAMFG